VLSKTCHCTEIFGRSSAEPCSVPSAKTLALAERYKGMFGAPLVIRAWMLIRADVIIISTVIIIIITSMYVLCSALYTVRQ